MQVIINNLHLYNIDLIFLSSLHRTIDVTFEFLSKLPTYKDQHYMYVRILLILQYYFITIQFPFRFEPILSMTFFFCNDINARSIVLFVTPIFEANSSAVYSESSINKEMTFFSVLFNEILPTLLPTLLPTFSLLILSKTTSSNGIVQRM